MVCHEFCKTSVARKSALLALSVSLLLPAGAKDWPVASVVELVSALGQAQSGDTLTLAAGTYDLAETKMDADGSSHLVVDRPLEIRCANDSTWRSPGNRTPAVLKGDGSVRILRITSSATFRGLSFVGGKSSENGAGVWIDTSGAGYVADFTNCVFAACVNDGGDGGGIFSAYSASAVVRDCLLDGNSAQKNGGGAVRGSYYDCVFSNNVAVTAGGGALSSGIMQDCVCGGNRANWGGAGSYVTATRCAFYGNVCGLVGGAMSNSKAIDCLFEANEAGGKGGGALYGDNPYEVRGCTFLGNAAKGANGAGGAILNPHAVSNCTFRGNSAVKGGALSDVRTTAAVEAFQPVAVMDSAFLTNTAAAAGGAVAACDAMGCRFEGNEADKGGAVTLATLAGCELVGNRATTYGGAAFEVETCADCMFADNSVAVLDGGAIYQTRAGASLLGCEIRGNRVSGAYRKGGGIFCTAGGSSMLVTNCVIRENRAEGTCSAGGVFYATNVVGCVFHDNTSGYYSGHAWYSAFRDCRFSGKGEVAMSRMVNCEIRDYRAANASYSAPLVANERAGWEREAGFPVLSVTNCLVRDGICGDIVRVTGDEARFANCTFASNVCENAFYLARGNNDKEPSLDVANCVFGGNGTGGGGAMGLRVEMKFAPSASIVSLRQLLSEAYDLPSAPGAAQSTGLLSRAVRFCGEGNPFGEPAYALHPSRHWIDKGVVWGGAADMRDLAGRPRVWGGGIDLGCYECPFPLPGMVVSVR